MDALSLEQEEYANDFHTSAADRNCHPDNETCTATNHQQENE